MSRFTWSNLEENPLMTFKTVQRITLLLALLVAFFGVVRVSADPLPPINFSASQLIGEDFTGSGANRPTSLQFGPDGRLYVMRQDGMIFAYTIVRAAANNYIVTATEQIDLVHNIPNYNDDGQPANNVNGRLSTGLLVVGTANNPVIYTTSSDPRSIYSGAGETLDTNSGIISRLQRVNGVWEKVDLVRGLPRSAEYHAPNGLQLDTATNTLYVAIGGHTNVGAPDSNLAYVPEYALSAAILEVDLDALNNLGVQSNGDHPYVYDIPTLDDDERSNTTFGVDENDPFGGNRGKNMARVVAGGPVKIFSPGYRNPYDLVLTEAGRLYTVDNGPNAGFGGFMTGEEDVVGAPGQCTNDSGNNVGGVGGWDNLHLVTKNFYGGHPNPTRGNPNLTYNAPNGLNDLGAQRSVPAADTRQCNFIWSGNGSNLPEDGSLATWAYSTNGITEYTASNFAGQMKGDLLTVSFDDTIQRVELNAAGDAATNVSIFGTLPGGAFVPLDITAQSDFVTFPGTVWVAAHSGAIVVYEPADYGGIDPQLCDENAVDSDGDGFTNADELANGTNTCNASSTPPDNDGDKISDLTDTDDDNDGIADLTDAFQVDGNNGLATNMPVYLDFDPAGNTFNTGLLESGFTGLMTNGSTDYLDMFDAAEMTVGGIVKVFTIDAVSTGDAYGAQNDQDYAFQLGVNVSDQTGVFTVATRMSEPFFEQQAPTGEQSQGLFIGTGDMDNYAKLVLTTGGFELVMENGGAVVTEQQYTAAFAGASVIELLLSIDPQAGTIYPRYIIDGGAVVEPVATPIALPAGNLLDALQAQGQAIAAGIISTSRDAAPFTALWDTFSVTADAPGVIEVTEAVTDFGSYPVNSTSPTQTLTLQNMGIGSDPSVTINDFNIDSSEFEIVSAPATPLNLAPQQTATVEVRYTPTIVGPPTGTFTVTHDGVGGQSTALLKGRAYGFDTPIYRVNAGAGAVGDWTADTDANPSPYLVSTGMRTAGGGLGGAPNNTGAPNQIFNRERWDEPGGDTMRWQFPADGEPALPEGDYRVNLYFSEGYFTAPGVRQFNIVVDDVQVETNFDIYAEAQAETGNGEAAIVRSYTTRVDAGNPTIDLAFLHGAIQNPSIRGIEIQPVSFNGPGVLEISTETIDFGDVNNNTTSTPQQITLTNTGETADPSITISNIALGGDNADQFGLTGAPLALAPGESTTLDLTFAPTSLGSKAAQLVIDHDGVGNQFIVGLSGEGVVPSSSLALSEELADFGTQTLFTVSDLISITLDNLGEAGDPDIEIESVEIMGTGANDFTYTLTDNIITQGGSTTLDLAFQPLVTGLRSAMMVIVHNGDNSPMVLDLTGQGFATNTPIYRVNAGGPQVAANDGGIPWEADLNNVGSDYLASPEGDSNPYGNGNFNAPNDTGAPNAIFGHERWDPNGASEMAWSFPVSTGNYQVNLYFAEIAFNATGVRSFDVLVEGEVVLDDFDQFANAQTEKGNGRAALMYAFPVNIAADGETIDIELQHVVENPAIKGLEIISLGADTGSILTADVVDVTFPDQQVGTASTPVIVTLTNGGTSGSPAINITGITAGNPQYQVNGPAVATLNPGESTTFEIVFVPTSGGRKTTNVTVEHDGANLAIPVRVTGVGVIPTSSLETGVTNVDFGFQNVNEASDAITIDLQNMGEAGDPDIEVTSVTITGDDADQFAHDFTAAFMLPQGGANGTIDVTFTPTSAGTKLASLRIEHDGDNSPVVVPLAGDGRVPSSDLEVGPQYSGGVDFGSQQFGTTSFPLEIPFNNTGLPEAGDPVINITNAEIQGTNAAEFNLLPDYPTSIAPGTSGIFRVTFAPVDENAKTAELIITHDGANSPTVIGLSGAGLKDPEPPYVTSILPAPGATNVPLDLGIVADVFLPREGAGVDPTTLVEENVYVYQTSDVTQTPVPATYSTSGGADTISILPSNPLQPNTNYTVVITENVQDASGVGFVPFTSTFTTGAGGGGGTIPGVEFEQLPSGASGGNVYNSVTVGPDGRLYAAAFGGVYHWDIEADGTLTKETFRPMPADGFGGSMRMLVGIEFDPRSTANTLILWITHNEGMSFINDTEGPHFTGALTRITIANPGTGQENWTFEDMAVAFPRSVRDHLTNSLEFGPDISGDGNQDLLLTQGSISAMGERDNAWGLEPETILAGNVLQIDPIELENYVTANGGPLNVATGFVTPGSNNLQDANNFGLGDPEVTAWPAPGSFYNPYHPDAPITIFANGVRNAYDLVWHSNGEIYVPTNGSAAGGNSPATPGTLPASCKVRLDTVYDGAPIYTGPSVPAAFGIVKQDDYLFRVERGGYYGHPNPTHCTWVLNGGNPTAGDDPAQIGDHYPVGTQPDRAYGGFAFDFGPNKSANGVIEYQSNVFSGALRGKMLVARYNLGQDILVMEAGGPNNDIVATWDDIPGLGFGFVDPLDITEDASTGNLYVIEYDEVNPANIKITLVRPVGGDQPDAVVDVNELIFNQPIGAGASAPRSVVVTNEGAGTLTLQTPTTSGQFAVSNIPAIDTTLDPGEFTTVDVTFDPSVAGPQVGSLTILSDDPTDPAISVTLRGLGTNGLGGANEPSLQWILDTYNYDVTVGDDAPATNIINSINPDAPQLGEELNISTFERADTGLVTIEPLAVFGPNDTPVTTVGWYQAGNPGTTTVLFNVENGSHQTLNPVVSGSTSFNPGTTPFGFYSVWPFFADREVFSEDQFNTFNGGGHNVRIYPLKDGNGQLVQDAYIVAFEEEENANDFQDVVFVVRNVRPASVTSGVLEISPRFFGFGAVTGSGTTASRPLTLRNTGVAPITINNIDVTGPFNLVGGFAGTIPVGGEITVDFNFATPGTAGAYTGTITIDSNASDPTVEHIIAGVAAVGEGGNNEPSLQRILNAYNIPVDTGDDDEATTPIHQTPSVARGLRLGEQVRAQAFTKADNGQPVTMEILGGYAIDGDPIVNVGWYPDSNPGSRSQVFSVNQGTDQTLDMRFTGNLSFNPGNDVPFGLYAEWVPDPWFGRLTFQNDEYNRFFDDTTTNYSLPNHVRVFPLRDANGFIVPNAYIVAYEEWTNGFDYNDIVLAVFNVEPIPEVTAPSIEIENLDWETINEIGLPGMEWMNEYITFHKMRVPFGDQITGLPEGEEVIDKDTATVRIHNRSSTSLQIFSIAASNNHTGGASFDFPGNEDVVPPVIGPNDFYDLDITYIGNLGTTAKGVFLDTLTIQSNDPIRPTVEIPLSVIYTQRPVGPNEPSVRQVAEGFGFTTNIGGGLGTAPFPTSYVASGEEVLSPYWEQADPNLPIYARQLAALHGCCGPNGQERIEFRRVDQRPATGANQPVTNGGLPLAYIDHDHRWGQTVLPANLNTEAEGWLPAEVLFTAYNGSNGVKHVFYTRTNRNFDMRSYDAYERGDDSVRHRFWPVRDPEGNLVPNTFIMGIDYVGFNHQCESNGDGLCDFNDNIYLISNIQPAEFNGVTFNTDLAVSITEEADPILRSDELIYTVTAENLTVHEAPNAVLTITLPDNAPIVSIEPAGLCGTPSGGQVTCNLGTMSGGAVFDIVITATPLSGGERTISASISTSRAEDALDNNDASETTSVLDFESIPATITIVKDAQPDTDVPFNFTGDAGNFQLIDDPNAPPVVDVRVNFQPADFNGGNPPATYNIADFGQPFGADGNNYGWFNLATDLPADASAGLRARTTGGFNDAQRTFNHMQQPGEPEYFWEYAVPNGTYEVTVSVGDTQFFDSTNALLVEGVAAFDPPFVPDSGDRVEETTLTVEVTDGALTIAPDQVNGVNTKLNYVHITGGRPNTQSFLVSAGTYEITEILPPLWRLDNVTCDADFTAQNNGVELDVESEDSVVCTFVNTEITGPEVELTKEVDQDEILAGESVTFTITVSNTGLTALNDVTIVDEIAPQCNNTFATIPTSGVESYDCTVDNVEESFTNVATVTASPADGSDDVTDTATVDVTVVTPGILITKSPDTQSGLDAGDTANFDITVVNTGDVDLDNVTVVDPQSPTCDRAIGQLQVGDSFSYSCQSPDVQTTFTNVATVTATWNGNEYTAQDSAVVILDGVAYGTPLYRVNAGGPTIGSIDGGPSWVGVTGSGNQTFDRADGAATGSVSAGQSSSSGTVTDYDESVPLATTPPLVLNTSRFVQPAGTNMNWSFPVPNGDYEVRLFFANLFGGTATEGSRVFNINVEGSLQADDGTSLTDYDIIEQAGDTLTGIMEPVTVSVTDGVLNVSFSHGAVENPMVNAIEIVPVTQLNPAVLSATPSTYDFGNVPVDGVPRSITITLQHLGEAGSAPINLSNLQLTGADADQFVLDTGGTASVLGAGNSTTFQVNFTPDSFGAKTAAVNITHDGENGGVDPLTVFFGGTGIPVPLPNLYFGETDQPPVTTLEFTTEVGTGAVSESLGIFTTETPANFTIDLAGAPAWLDVAPLTGVANGTDTPEETQVTITADNTGLDVGTYTYTLEATATDFVPATLEITLNVIPTQYTITTEITNGTINPAGPFTVDAGSDQSFTITPDDGYRIESVLVNGLNITTQVVDGVFELTDIQEDKNIVVNLVTVPTYTIEASVDGVGGTIDPSGTITVNEGDDQTFTITPDAGFLIAGVEVNGLPQGPISEYTFTNITSDHTIVARFEQSCSPYAPGTCEEVPVSLVTDFCLAFNGTGRGLVDTNGTPTGFTMVDPPSQFVGPIAGVPGYNPANLEIINDELVITATQGIQFNTVNTQENALGVAFDATRAPGETITLRTNMTSFPAGGANDFLAQQGGIWFGLDEDRYVKLVVRQDDTIQLFIERGPGDFEEFNDGIPDNAAIGTPIDVELILELDPNANTMSGFYSLDGGAVQTIATDVPVPAEYFTGIALPGGTETYSFGGLFGTTRNFVGTIDFAFADFCIEPSDAAPNTPPVIDINDGLTVVEGQGAVITTGDLSASDAEHLPTEIVYTVTTLPANGTLNQTVFTQSDLANNRVVYTHDGSETAADSFEFIVSDPSGGVTPTQVFNITVTPANDAPVLVNNLPLAVNEGQAATITDAELLYTDEDLPGDTLTYTITTAPINGTLTVSGTALGVGDTFTQDDINNGNVTYTHNGTQTTLDSFGYALSDGTVSLPGVFNFVVTLVNDPPVETENNTLFVPEGGTATIDNSRLLYTDEEENANQITYTITAAPVNGTLQRGQTVLGLGDTFKQVAIDNGLMSYTHDGSETSTDSFSFEVTDGVNPAVTGTFNIVVSGVNNPPQIVTNETLNVDEGATGTITTALLETEDAEQGTAEIQYTIVSVPEFGVVRRDGTPLAVDGTFTQEDIDNGLVTYEHGGGENATDSFGFTVTDGFEGSDDAPPTTPVPGTFNITVNPVNDAPQVSINNPLVVVRGEPATLPSSRLLYTDVDNPSDQVVYTVTSKPQHGSLLNTVTSLTNTFSQSDINNGNVVYTHDGSAPNADSFTFEVTDGEAAPITDVFNITIVDEGARPVANDDTATTGFNTPVTINVLANDTGDIDPATVIVTNPPQSGLAASDGAGNIIYTPSDGFTGTDTFQYTVDSTIGLISNAGTVTVEVIAGPVVTVNTGLEVGFGQTATITNGMLRAEDPNNGPEELIYTITEAPTNGTILLNGVGFSTSAGGSFSQADINNGLVSYQQSGVAEPTDSFTFTVTDGVVTTDPQTFNITVADVVNVAPTNLFVTGDLTSYPLELTYNWTHKVSNEATTVPADWYHIVVNKDGSQVVDLWVTAADACQGVICAVEYFDKEPPFVFDNGDYIWYVEAWTEPATAGGQWSSVVSDTATFTVNVPTIAPPTGVVVVPNQGRSTISWDDDPAATWYQIYLGNANGTVYSEWVDKASIDCDGTRCSFTPPADPVGGTYDYWLRSWGPTGFSSGGVNGWHGPYSVTLPTTPPVAPNGLISSGEVTGNPVFAWEGVANATWYQLWVGERTGQNQWRTSHIQWYLAADLGCENMGVCQLNALIDLPNGNYDWAIRAWGPGGLSVGGVIAENWTNISGFAVDALTPGIPTLGSPLGTSGAPVSSFSWTGVPGASWYQLWIGDQNQNELYNGWFRAQDLGCADNIATCFIDFGQMLPAADYTWAVRAYSPAGVGEWSSAERFQAPAP